MRFLKAINPSVDAKKAAKTGMVASLAFSGWIGLPVLLPSVFGHGGVTSIIEMSVIGILVAVGLAGAWQFGQRRGFVVGPVLLVALAIEIIKQIALAVAGSDRFDIFDGIISLMIGVGLVHGLRGIRALRSQ